MKQVEISIHYRKQHKVIRILNSQLNQQLIERHIDKVREKEKNLIDAMEIIEVINKVNLI